MVTRGYLTATGNSAAMLLTTLRATQKTHREKITTAAILGESGLPALEILGSSGSLPS